MKREIYIHIGMPKTGTTALQKNFFNAIGELNHLSRENAEITENLLHPITDREPLEYNNKMDDFKDYVFNNLMKEEGKYLISSEALCSGSSHDGKVDRYLIAHRLKELFPDAVIILVLREQREIIKSVFKQMLKFQISPGTSFREWLDNEYSKLHCTSILHYFQYDKIINLYNDLFDGRLKVLLYEDFISDHNTFLKKFCEIFDIKSDDVVGNYDDKVENLSITKRKVFVNRIVNKAPLLEQVASRLPLQFKNLINKLISGGEPVPTIYTEKDEEVLAELYKAGNESIESTIGLPLKRNGYF